jgi:hypothetical protein
MAEITGGRLSVTGDWGCNYVKIFYRYKIFLYEADCGGDVFRT